MEAEELEVELRALRGRLAAALDDAPGGVQVEVVKIFQELTRLFLGELPAGSEVDLLDPAYR